MRLRLMWISGLAAVIGGCAPQSSLPPAPLSPAVLGAAEMAAVEKGLRDAMKDGPSARLGPVSAVRDGRGMVHVCGTVNGRNSYGGYTGFQPYVGVLSEFGSGDKRVLLFAPAAFGSDATGEQVIRARCTALGLTI